MFIQITLKKKAQSLLEYAFLIVFVVGAMISMNSYLKRGYQGKIKTTADDLGRQWASSTTANNSVATYEHSVEKAHPGDVSTDFDPRSGQASYRHTMRSGSETGQSDFRPGRIDTGANLTTGAE